MNISRRELPVGAAVEAAIRMRWRVCVAAVLLALSVGSGAQTRPVKTLLLVGGGFHDYDKEPQSMAQSLQTRLKDTSPLDIVISQDLGLLRAERIRDFGLLMMNTCAQDELSAEQQQGLLDAVRNGTPLVALHCTFAAFQKFPQFHQMLGGFVLKHARYGPMCVEVTNPGHPITRGLPARFEFPDEPYFVERRDPSVELLLRTCNAYEGRTGPEPHVWTKTFGKGRIFAMVFGHDRKSQDDPNVQRLLAQGVLWALNR
jgi:hypothetical protein